MKNKKHLVVLQIILIVMTSLAYGQQSGQVYHKYNIMNGNDVRTVFGNWGVIGQPSDKGPRGAWKNDNNGYIGDVTPLVGAEVQWSGNRFHSVATCPVDRPGVRDRAPDGITYWTFEPQNGYANPLQDKIAISNRPSTWPSFWPDVLTDTKDPGWRGSWNGYFGKNVFYEDLGSYYVMDDNNDARFNDARYNAIGGSPGVAFKPDSTNNQRNGLGLEMSVRAMQWNDPLAKDNIFWLYEISNKGTTTYTNACFGAIVGTYVGVTGTDDSPQEYKDDWSFYDVTTNLTYTGDYKRGGRSNNPKWVGRVGMVGYAFLESPGNPYDGIDNDGDADSSIVGRTAPRFTATMFTDSIIIAPGKQVIVINSDYSRSTYAIPSTVDSLIIPTRGNAKWVYTGRNPLFPSTIVHSEGNAVTEKIKNTQNVLIDTVYINPNAYDGVDNDYDGLIDENQYLHFRAVKKDQAGKILLDVPHAVHYIDYGTGNGASPYSMIDERRNDAIDNNRDWDAKYDDVGRDGKANTGDVGEGDGLPTSGYLASGVDAGGPGEPHIDKTDVRESDQVGLTSFFYYTPSDQLSLADDSTLWSRLSPGLFFVPGTIINNKPVGGEDGDFAYGSGYFPLLAKTTERFSLALVYGGGYGGSPWPDADIADLLKNKGVVQQIYDANYKFPIAPDKPQVTAVTDSNKVTLYWDRLAEASVDPVLNINDFQGYKIYKSTDPDFSDVNTITNAEGIPKRYVPIATYDLVDSVSGLFRANAIAYQLNGGLSFELGTNSGLQHTFVDTDVQNGRRYYYAVTAYDRGNEDIGLYPKENPIKATVLPTGEVEHDVNIVVVTPNAKTAGYVAPPDTMPVTHAAGTAGGSVMVHTIDPTKVTGHQYQITFYDTANDTLDNNANGIKDQADSTEWNRITSFYNVKDLTTIDEPFMSLDTVLISLKHQNLDPSTAVVRNAGGTVVSSSKYRLDVKRGVIRSNLAGDLPRGDYTISYQYYPVLRSPNIQKSPFAVETFDTDIFDGVQLVFKNYWMTVLDETNSKWINTPNQYAFNMSGEYILNNKMKLYRKPSDYEIRIDTAFVDTSVAHPAFPFVLDQVPVKFRIYNLTDSAYIKFYYAPSGITGSLTQGDQLVFLEKGLNGNYVPSWTVFMADTIETLAQGALLRIKTTKPFNSGDRYEFTSVAAKSEAVVAKQQGMRVRAVPNPYVTASQFELPLPPSVTSGRGTRKMDFIHLPANATVKIFTARGDHVITLQQDGNIEDGAVSWNLKTKENLDIAFGVYFYVVESPAGNQTGKIAIIK